MEKFHATHFNFSYTKKLNKEISDSKSQRTSAEEKGLNFDGARATDPVFVIKAGG